MIVGHVRDNFPRVTLALPGQNGPARVEFIVDTGFDGELAIPGFLLRELDAALVAERAILLADGSERHLAHYEIVLDWNEEPHATEIIAMEGLALLGNLLLEGCQISIDMTDGGEVVIDFS